MSTRSFGKVGAGGAEVGVGSGDPSAQFWASGRERGSTGSFAGVDSDGDASVWMGTMSGDGGGFAAGKELLFDDQAASEHEVSAPSTGGGAA